MAEQPDILAVIAQNTIAVLTTAPEQKDEWGQQVFQLHSQARSRSDAAMVALTNAVLALLRGKAANDLSPDLSGPHAECWGTIAEALKQWQHMRRKEGTGQSTGDSAGNELRRILQELSQSPSSLQEMPHRIELCRRALNLVSRSQQHKLWAALQATLGNSLAQTPLGNPADNLEQAIGYYRAALEEQSRERVPLDWAQTMSNLGAAYFSRIKGERADNIEQAISCYQAALEERRRERVPLDWAATMSNLGIAYADRIEGERADNLDEAIGCFRTALEERRRERVPLDWAATMSNLGLAYLDRIEGERADNLEQAIGCFRAALEEQRQERVPLDWAATMSNLGLAYLDRIEGERADNLDEAIGCFRAALEEQRRERVPLDWAQTMSNLGAAYRSRIAGERADNLEQAIGCFQLALEERRRERVPLDWAATMSNLGNAYYSRIEGERADNLDEAIGCFRAALEEQRRERVPLDWAQTMSNLGAAYFSRIKGERADNIEQAISCYQAALEERRRERVPLDWAATMSSLGNAYYSRIEGERAENLKQAIHHYQQALEVYTREAFPADHRRASRSLGNLYFTEQRWRGALNAYQSAIIAGDLLLAASYSEVGRQAEIGETGQLFSRAAYCLLQIHELDEALLMLESGKTRLLTEALALGNADLEMLPEIQRKQIEELRAKVQSREAEMRILSIVSEEPEAIEIEQHRRALLAELRDARTRLTEAIEDIRKEHPDFMPTGLDLSDLLALIPPEGALVAPLVTSQGSAVFVIPHGAQQVTEDCVAMLNELTDEELNDLLMGTEEEPGWLRAYIAYRNDEISTLEWGRSIQRITGALWEKLFALVHERLQQVNASYVILMPSAGLQLLPLHAVWWTDEVGEQHTLLDEYTITYAPSGYALKTSQERAARNGARGAVVGGINDYGELRPLFNAVDEAVAIAELFDVEALINNEVTQDALAACVKEAAFLHLSCHGSFAWEHNAQQSALFLANGEPLSLAHILSRTLDLTHNRLVTLSACETGITDIRQSPDEFVGLLAGFIQAGAPAVVSSLWVVDDRSTALLMERFYKNHLEKDLPLPAALREAQLWLRDATAKELGGYYAAMIAPRLSEKVAVEEALTWKSADDPAERPYASPFHWAAFTFTGAG